MNHKERPVTELRKELLEAVLQAWRKRGASEAAGAASSTFDALFGAENRKMTQQLTDLHAKKGKKEIHDLFAQLRTLDQRVQRYFRDGKKRGPEEDVGS